MEENNSGWIPDNSGLMRATERQEWYGQTQDQVASLIENDPGGDVFWYRCLSEFRPEAFDLSLIHI